MTLQNLVGLSLDLVEPSQSQAARLLAAAERNLVDAKIDNLSNENRFDVAYKAAMQLAVRTLTSRPGHHQTAIQALPQTVGLPIDQMIVLDTLRKQRNLVDYSGDLVPESAARECLTSATRLMHHVKHWIEINKPELL